MYPWENVLNRHNLATEQQQSLQKWLMLTQNIEDEPLRAPCAKRKGSTPRKNAKIGGVCHRDTEPTRRAQ